VYIGFNVAVYASERVQIFGRKNVSVDSTRQRALAKKNAGARFLGRRRRGSRRGRRL